MAVNQRFGFLVSALNLNTNSLAKKIGIAQPSISKIISGENQPSAKILIPLLEQYPTINMNWLLMGTGEMFLTETDNIEERIAQRDKVIQLLEDSVADLRRTIEMYKQTIEDKNVIINKLKEKEKMA